MVNSRRKFLQVAGSSIAIGLAGCSSTSDTAPTEDSPPTTTTTATDGTPTTTAGDESTTEDTTTAPDTPISEVSGIPVQGFDAGRTHYAQDEQGPTTGFKQRWIRSVAPSGSLTQPVIVDGTIYSVGERKLYALNPAKKGPKWTFTPSAANQQGDSETTVTGSPAVVGDTVVVGGNTGTLYGLSASDGSINWRFTPDIDVTRWSDPAVVDGTIFVTAASDGTPVTVFAIETGGTAKRWSRQLQGNPWECPDPAVGNNAVCVETSVDTGNGSQDTLFALDQSTGETNWQRSGVHQQYGAPIVANGMVYSRRTSSGKPVALAVGDGSEQWVHSTGARLNAVTADRAHLSESDRVVAVSAQNGARQWEKEARRDSISVVAGETVYVGQAEPTESGGLYALRRSDGKQLAKAGGFPTDPDGMAVVDGYVFVVGGLGMWVLESP